MTCDTVTALKESTISLTDSRDGPNEVNEFMNARILFVAAIVFFPFLSAPLFSTPLLTPSRAADVLVVCPQPLRPSLAPWLQHRRAEGLDVVVTDSHADAVRLDASLAELADDATRYVMLVGDAPAIGTPCDPQRSVPTHYLKTTVTAAWGSTPTLASDLAYGDFDNNGVPEAAVGRLPVDSRDQLSELVGRILAYEQSSDFGSWRGQVQLTGGVGGFGTFADAAIESVTRAVVTGVLPAETKTTIAYASPGHRFFPDAPSFTDAVLDRYSRGSRFWVYAGHGWIDQLDRVPHSSAGIPVLDSSSVNRLNRAADGAPIALLLACYTGAMDAPGDCLAEQMLLAEGGPIAVFAGSRVTMPYGNATAAVALIDGVYAQKLPRLGDAWHSSLLQMAADDASANKSTTRVLIDALATLISPAGTEIAEERREHMRLYNLMGDPTLRLHPPKSLTLQVPAGHVAGTPIKLKLKSPIAGKLTISLDRPLGSVADGDPNQTTVASLTAVVEPDQLVTPSIVLPATVSGPIVVRALVAGKKVWATAAATVMLR